MAGEREDDTGKGKGGVGEGMRLKNKASIFCKGMN